MEESERPSLRILQEAEELAREINDGSLKLFCRDVVEKCKAGFDPMPSQIRWKMVLFEDGSEVFADNIENLVDNDPDMQSSISFPPLSVADVKEDILSHLPSTVQP